MANINAEQNANFCSAALFHSPCLVCIPWVSANALCMQGHVNSLQIHPAKRRMCDLAWYRAWGQFYSKFSNIFYADKSFIIIWPYISLSQTPPTPPSLLCTTPPQKKSSASSDRCSTFFYAFNIEVHGTIIKCLKIIQLKNWFWKETSSFKY